MSAVATSLIKNPVLEPAEDFYRLRREGIGFIEQMGHDSWTDYNVHDPGITILEALCYAITDIAYRAGWDVKDLLTGKTAPSNPADPYPDQAFFTARKILTVNPTTPDDLRRLLIDLDRIRNAWVLCKACACDVMYYAWCGKDGQLALSYEKPADPKLISSEVWARGLYDAMLELEADPELGDLNDRKIERKWITQKGSASPATLELRFPNFARGDRDQWESFVGNDDVFEADGKFKLHVTRFGATRTYDVLTAPGLDDAGKDGHVRSHWRDIFYLSYEIRIIASGESIRIENATLRLFGNPAAKAATTFHALRTVLEDASAAGFIRRYRQKVRKTLVAVKSARTVLLAHRNLDEDYCSIGVVGIEEIAACADVEVKPDADIERVQARIWYEIEQYLNPPIRFNTLQEMRDSGAAVEDIFNGPALASGFIKAPDLEAARLKGVLRVSDIVNKLMDIDGVIAVNHLLLTKYDAQGNVVRGAADPTWTADKPVFDGNKLSASWLMFVSNAHQPRLYLNASRFLFYKNGLPFQPRMAEAMDTLNQLRGEAERAKNYNASNDLPIPKGRFREPEDYYPVQYSLPQTYGIGPAGLSSDAPAQRVAQARQLKAYLTVFEQVLGNILAQLAHVGDLFSLDPAQARTRFVMAFDNELINGFDVIAQPAMSKKAIERMVETEPEFQERRNRFLDHLLARFGEQFSEYALLLGNAAGRQAAQARLIQDKISFLKRYPLISHDRARAFDYSLAPCSPENFSGIKKRISLLLGYPDLSFVSSAKSLGGNSYRVGFRLIDGNAKPWLAGELTLSANAEAQARQAAYRAIIERMAVVDAYDCPLDTGQVHLTLLDHSNVEIGRHPTPFDSVAAAAPLRDELMAWSANERLIVVEHLLLRPKFIGDALYPACSDGECRTCGDEDPYSFRLTYVMPGWTSQYANDLDLRRFAERTIQRETPSHLVGKTCWVGNDGLIENLCDEVIGELAGILMSEGHAESGVAPSEQEACVCANAIYQAFSAVFRTWYEDKTLDYFHPAALEALISSAFSSRPSAADIHCATVIDAALWANVQKLMVKHFVATALHGWQFERFEAAWCAWLDANAKFDWTREDLHDRVQAILEDNVITPTASAAALCKCAGAIVGGHGAAFFAWMDGNLKAGHSFAAFTPFTPPPPSLCPGLAFKAATAATIEALLNRSYDAYREVSYRLRIVVDLLSNLRNTYPAATLHDCDDGGDHNPVRLDSTALGNYPLHSSLT